MKLATSTIGAIGELMVSAFLLERGLPVFRALSPACPFDIAVLCGDSLVGVEVRTLTMLKSGKMSFDSTHQGADLIAARVRGDNRILFFSVTEKGSELLTKAGIDDYKAAHISAFKTHDTYGYPVYRNPPFTRKRS